MGNGRGQRRFWNFQEFASELPGLIVIVVAPLFPARAIVRIFIVVIVIASPAPARAIVIVVIIATTTLFPTSFASSFSQRGAIAGDLHPEDDE